MTIPAAKASTSSDTPSSSSQGTAARAPDGRVGERQARVPSTFRASHASLTSSGRQVSRIVSSYSKRVSSDSPAVGQGALKDGRQLDVTSFIGGELYNHWS